MGLRPVDESLNRHQESGSLRHQVVARVSLFVIHGRVGGLAAQFATHVHVLDSFSGQIVLQRGSVKMRGEAGRRLGPDVDQNANRVAREQFQELLDSLRRVTYGKQHIGQIGRSYSSALWGILRVGLRQPILALRFRVGSRGRQRPHSFSEPLPHPLGHLVPGRSIKRMPWIPAA